MTEFFAMGGYAFYVWGSYAAAAIILGGISYLSYRSMTRSARRLDALKAAAPHRRRKRETAYGSE